MVAHFDQPSGVCLRPCVVGGCASIDVCALYGHPLPTLILWKVVHAVFGLGIKLTPNTGPRPMSLHLRVATVGISNAVQL